MNKGSKGVWLGLGDPVRELPREFLGRRRCRAASPTCASSAAAASSSAGPRYADEPDAARVAAHPAFAGWPLVVLTDEPARAARSPMNFLWTTFTRFEPAADIAAAETAIVRNHLAYTGPVVIDARMKPGFPKELFCDDADSGDGHAPLERVLPGGGVEMGDSERAHLD